MPTNIGILMAVVLVANARGGCGPDNTGMPPAGAGASGGVTTGKVAGTVTDLQGQPLSGAEIDICNPIYFNSCVDGKTGPDGRYSFDLQPVNVWTAAGSITRMLNGQSYCFDLSPSSTATFSSADGAIRDFQWKLSGLRPDKSATDESTSFYGAALLVIDDNANFAIDDRYIRVALTPQGDLVDGSNGHGITAMVGDWKWNQIGNIPLGRYLVTADYLLPGNARTALLVGTASGQYAASVVLDFDPAQGGTCGSPQGTIHVRP